MISQQVPATEQRTRDESHLTLLAIFHVVGAWLALAGIGFLGLHFTLMRTIFTNPAMWKNHNAPPPPAEFFAIFKWVYLIGAVWCAVSLILNLASSICLWKRRCRTFSIVVAGVNCLHIPLGTVLGVFTIITLRDSVVRLYDLQPKT